MLTQAHLCQVELTAEGAEVSQTGGSHPQCPPRIGGVVCRFPETPLFQTSCHSQQQRPSEQGLGEASPLHIRVDTPCSLKKPLED